MKVRSAIDTEARQAEERAAQRETRKAAETTPKPPCPRCGQQLELTTEKKPYFYCFHCGWEGKKLKPFKYFGAVSRFVEGVVTWKGRVLISPRIDCPKCGGKLDLDNLLDAEGKALVIIVYGMEGYGKLQEQRNTLIEEWNQHKSGKRTITGGLYTLANKLESISRKIENLEAQGLNRVEHKQKTPIRCPHCTVPLGYLDVTLKLTVPHAELKRETWEQYYAVMGTPPVTVRAKVASDLGFENWDALKRWADNPDLPKLLEMAEQFKSKLSELDVDASLTYDFSTKLNNLVDTLPKAIRERKRRVVEAVVDLAQEEAAQRTR